MQNFTKFSHDEKLSESFNETYNENSTTSWCPHVKIRQNSNSKSWYRYIKNFDIFAGHTIWYNISISNRYFNIFDISVSIYRYIKWRFLTSFSDVPVRFHVFYELKRHKVDSYILKCDHFKCSRSVIANYFSDFIANRK